MSTQRRHLSFSLVRHGQARAADGVYHDDTPLSELGRRQARAVVHGFRGDRTPSVVYSSPYVRARETAAPLCRALGLEPILDDRLREFDMPPSSLEQIGLRPDLEIWRPEHRGAHAGETPEIDYWPRGRAADGAPRYASLVRIGDTSHLAGLDSEI